MSMTHGAEMPLVIGVTGHMGIAGLEEAEQKAIRSAVSRVFQFLRSSQPVEGWDSGLELNEVPMRLLTSLAPGADQIVAELAEEHGIEVVAPLPFPEELYLRASTFNAKSSGESRHASLVKHLPEAKKNAETTIRELGDRAFFVPLHRDEDLSASELQAQLEKDLNDSTARRLRYRAAGEYVAVQCHLLIALTHDLFNEEDAVGESVELPLKVQDDREMEAGAHEILTMKQRGMTPGLLVEDPAFTWANSGPVVHIYTPRIDREKNKKNAPDAGTITWVYPYDAKPQTESNAKIAYDSAQWVDDGQALFEHTVGELNKFHARRSDARSASVSSPKSNKDPIQREMDELSNMLTPEGVELLAGAGEEYHRDLDQMSRLRRSAADLAGDLRDKKISLLGWLFLVTLLGVFTFHLSTHWHPAASHGSAHAGELAQTIFLGITILFVLAALRLFQTYRISGEERHLMDYRSLSEGLRVQIYWAAAGLNQSVPANYLQRQRVELDWIRRAIGSVAAPYHRWDNWFRQLKTSDQVQLLKCITKKWVNGQQSYFSKTAFDLHERRHIWHFFGIALACTGLTHAAIQMVLLLSHQTDPNLNAGVFRYLFITLSLVIVTGGALGWLRATKDQSCARKSQATDKKGLYERWQRAFYKSGSPSKLEQLWAGFRGFGFSIERIGQRLTKTKWGGTVLFIGLVTLWSWSLCVVLSSWCDCLPGFLTWWTILGGMALVSGGISVAWVDKQLMAEQERQYSSMAALFLAGQRRIDGHLEDAELQLTKGKEDIALQRIEAIQDLCFALGRQALDENAEWLILHRARPLEPILPG